MGGTTAFDSMMAFYITDQLPLYENDPVVVAAMKDACHHNLYAIAHSCGMNNVGPNTVIKAKTPGLISTVRIAAIVFCVVFVASLVLWILNAIKFKKTEVYANYKEFKRSCKK